MIFTGDIAQPFVNASSFVIPEELESYYWIGNLEGSLIKRGDNNNSETRGVFNDCGAIKDILNQVPFKAFIIANNHLLDFAGVQTTLENANTLNVPVVGSGLNLPEAQHSLVVKDTDGIVYRVLAFGWENIQCVPARKNKQGVNPYTRKNVLSCVREALNQFEPVICFIHWDYELEKYPQPYDRKLAHLLIDMGVSAVIGCHSHRVQPIEFYKGKPIVYSLGNFLFFQGHYFGGKLSFPAFCEDEYAFEISGERYKLHYFHYDSKSNKLEYVKSMDIGEDEEYDGKAVFSCYTEKEYEIFFKKNRVQKKLLPIFKTHETAASYWLKSGWIKLRGWLLDTAMDLNIKSANRTDR